MEYAVLGATGRKVSRLGFGGAPAGIANYLDAYDPHDDRARQELAEAIRLAYELGVTYFDTAPAYGEGASEEIYGEGLRGIPPENIFLATKVLYGDYAYTRRSLEDSLRRLGREYVDLIQLHGTRYTDEMARSILGRGGQLEALEKAREEGLVKHIGFTVECQNRALYDFIESGRFETMQVEYNVMYQHPYDPNWKCGSMFDAEKKRMGIITMRTMTSHVFQQWMRQIRPDDDYDYSPDLLRFVLSNPLVDTALVGMRDRETVRANVRIAGNAAGRIKLEAVHNWYQ